MRFIAEMCQNHNGEIGVLAEQVAAAARAGFTHAKIQGLYSGELVRREEFEINGNPIFRPFDAEFKRLKSLELDETTELEFIQICQSHGLMPMITVFTHNGAERAIRLGFSSFKIASYDCESIPMMRELLDHADELIVSTGATDWNKISTTSDFLHSETKERTYTALLHARTIYPMPLREAGLTKLLALKTLGHAVGWSDHSNTSDKGLLASKVAAYLGAEVIERHFTVLPKSETKDGKVSIDESEASELRDFLDMNPRQQLEELEKDAGLLLETLRIDSLEPLEAEIQNAQYYRGRVASVIGSKTVFGWDSR